MSESYAKALVDLADEKNKLEPVHADVDAIGSLLKENRKLCELIMNPVVEAEKKRAVLAKIGKEAGFQKYTMNFLDLLVQKDRLPLLEEICESFEELYCKLTDTQVGARVFASLKWGTRTNGALSNAVGGLCKGTFSHRAGPAEM